MLVKTMAAVVGVALMIIGSPASARVSRGDPNDSDSRLDINLISVNGEPGVGGAMTIRTFEQWHSRYLNDARRTNLKWLFDNRDDGDIDLVGTFRHMNGRLLFFLRGTKTGNRYEPIRARRPDPRTVRVRFSFDIAELQSNNLSVVARSFSAERDCPVDRCRDRAPNTGRMDV
jgi:hypothetical protein